VPAPRGQEQRSCVENQARVSEHGPADIRAQHEEDAVREVEHIHQPENEGQAGGHQEEQRPQCQAGEQNGYPHLGLQVSDQEPDDQKRYCQRYDGGSIAFPEVPHQCSEKSWLDGSLAR